MPRKNTQVMDFDCKRSLYHVDAETARGMVARNQAFIVSNEPLVIALSTPPRKGATQIESRHPGPSTDVVGRTNDKRGRGTLIRGGKSGFENALIRIADGTSNAETVAAVEGWKNAS